MNLIPWLDNLSYDGVPDITERPYEIVLSNRRFFTDYSKEPVIVLDFPSWTLQTRRYTNWLNDFNTFTVENIRSIHPLELLPKDNVFANEIRRVYFKTGLYYFIGHAHVLFKVDGIMEDVKTVHPIEYLRRI